MAQTPWEMAAVGKEFSDQSALFAWVAMAKSFGVDAANDPLSYKTPGHARAIGGGMLDDALPQLKWLHAIKNQGHGDQIRGARSKAEGVKSGVSDMFLPVLMQIEGEPPFEGGFGLVTSTLYAGLYIELKRLKDGKPSALQLEFQADMRAAGYACEVVYGWEAARDLLLTYLGKG